MDRDRPDEWHVDGNLIGGSTSQPRAGCYGNARCQERTCLSPRSSSMPSPIDGDLEPARFSISLSPLTTRSLTAYQRPVSHDGWRADRAGRRTVSSQTVGL